MNLKAWDLSRHPRELARVICEVMDDMAPQQEEVNRMIGKLQPFLTSGICPAVFDQATGEAAGFLIVLGDGKKKPIRAANIWIREKWRRRGAALLLFDALLKEMCISGLAKMDISFIKSDNMASRLAVQTAGGRVIHKYCRYWMEV